jgi:hypothetical protein
VVDGDPLRDLSLLGDPEGTHILLVMQSGQIVKRSGALAPDRSGVGQGGRSYQDRLYDASNERSLTDKLKTDAFLKARPLDWISSR